MGLLKILTIKQKLLNCCIITKLLMQKEIFVMPSMSTFQQLVKGFKKV